MNGKALRTLLLPSASEKKMMLGLKVMCHWGFLVKAGHDLSMFSPDKLEFSGETSEES